MEFDRKELQFLAVALDARISDLQRRAVGGDRQANELAKQNAGLKAKIESHLRDSALLVTPALNRDAAGELWA